MTFHGSLNKAGLSAELMGTRSLFLLGTWLQRAREWANTTEPYSATCDITPGAPRRPCKRGRFEVAGRVCDGAAGSKTAVTTHCSPDAHCATCVNGSFGTANPSPCLSCEDGYTFFDFGLDDCTGSCNDASSTSIPIDLCEFHNCCKSDTLSRPVQAASVEDR